MISCTSHNIENTSLKILIHFSSVCNFAGFTVYKSVPYGPLTEVLPYLSRRAAENKVVLAGARREQELLMKEIRSRNVVSGS